MNTKQKDLTTREYEVLRLVAEGKTNPEIAEILSVTIYTIKAHVSSIIEKLNANGRTHAAVLGIKKGILTPELYFKE